MLCTMALVAQSSVGPVAAILKRRMLPGVPSAGGQLFKAALFSLSTGLFAESAGGLPLPFLEITSHLRCCRTPTSTLISPSCTALAA